jgi:hypothetical protein
MTLQLRIAPEQSCGNDPRMFGCRGEWEGKNGVRSIAGCHDRESDFLKTLPHE